MFSKVLDSVLSFAASYAASKLKVKLCGAIAEQPPVEIYIYGMPIGSVGKLLNVRDFLEMVESVAPEATLPILKNPKYNLNELWVTKRGAINTVNTYLPNDFSSHIIKELENKL